MYDKLMINETSTVWWTSLVNTIWLPHSSFDDISFEKTVLFYVLFFGQWQLGTLFFTYLLLYREWIIRVLKMWGTHHLLLCNFRSIWRRKWQPPPVLLPGEPHGWRSLEGYSLWGHKESDTTQRLPFLFPLGL